MISARSFWIHWFETRVSPQLFSTLFWKSLGMTYWEHALEMCTSHHFFFQPYFHTYNNLATINFVDTCNNSYMLFAPKKSRLSFREYPFSITFGNSHESSVPRCNPCTALARNRPRETISVCAMASAIAGASPSDSTLVQAQNHLCWDVDAVATTLYRPP